MGGGVRVFLVLNFIYMKLSFVGSFSLVTTLVVALLGGVGVDSSANAQDRRPDAADALRILNECNAPNTTTLLNNENTSIGFVLEGSRTVWSLDETTNVVAYANTWYPSGDKPGYIGFRIRVEDKEGNFIPFPQHPTRLREPLTRILQTCK
jgi:hypothetical protein